MSVLHARKVMIDHGGNGTHADRVTTYIDLPPTLARALGP
jgi:hypothetical protein